MTVYNIKPQTFGPLGNRCGDLIAICNIIAWMRHSKKDPSIQFHFTPRSIQNRDYVHKFHNFLIDKDYLSKEQGSKDLPFHNISVWDFRAIIGDWIKIWNEPVNKEDKIVIFPVYDAEYNTQRNWTKEILDSIMDKYRKNYPNYRKIICSKDIPPPGLINLEGFEVSTDFMENIDHIMDCKIFYGGDSWASHLASSLIFTPYELHYVYSGRCMIHTLPFYFPEKGILNTYWQDFVGDAKWNID